MHMIHPPDLVDAVLMALGAASFAAGLARGRRLAHRDELARRALVAALRRGEELAAR